MMWYGFAEDFIVLCKDRGEATEAVRGMNGAYVRQKDSIDDFEQKQVRKYCNG